MLFDIISRIELLVERDKLDLAQQNLNDALSQYPDVSELHALQSEIYYKQGTYKKAAEAIERAIGTNPENDYVYYLKARIHLAQDEHKKAEKEIDMAISLAPERADYYGVKGSVRLNKGDFEEAVTLSMKGLEMEPDNTLCNNILSMAHSRMGKKEEAEGRINHLLQNDPENAFTHANAGYQFLRQGNIPKAKEHFSVALRIEPTQEYAKAGMAEAIKSSNVLYRKLLQFAFWIDKIGSKSKWALYIGVIVLVRIVPFLVPFYLVFIFWTWFTPPIANILLYFDKYGRYLLDEQERLLTKINAGLLVGSLSALGAFVFWVIKYDVNSGLDFLGLAFSFFIAMLPVYHLNAKKKTKKYLMVGFAIAFIGIGLVGWYMGFVMGSPDNNILWTALIFLGMLFTWLV